MRISVASDGKLSKLFCRDPSRSIMRGPATAADGLSSRTRIRDAIAPFCTMVSVFRRIINLPRAMPRAWLFARAKPRLSGFSISRYLRAELLFHRPDASVTGPVIHHHNLIGTSGYGIPDGVQAVKQQVAGIPVHNDKGYIHDQMHSRYAIMRGISQAEQLSNSFEISKLVLLPYHGSVFVAGTGTSRFPSGFHGRLYVSESPGFRGKQYRRAKAVKNLPPDYYRTDRSLCIEPSPGARCGRDHQAGPHHEDCRLQPAVPMSLFHLPCGNIPLLVTAE